MRQTVWIGWDPREPDAYAVALRSLRAHARHDVEAYAVDMDKLMAMGVYQRNTMMIHGRLWDQISAAPMSTAFAISRFLVPYLCRQIDQHGGQALFIDCDMMFRAPVDDLFALADPRFAVQVVKHDYVPAEEVKMDGQANQPYPRKNWSSVMLFNLDHPALQTLTIAKVNSWAGRHLHAFEWLDDQFLGELPPEWNHLVGINEPNPEAKLVHFTLGIPRMEGYADCEHSPEWWAYPQPDPPVIVVGQPPCEQH